MIPIEHEPDDFESQMWFGPNEENCCFCFAGTRYWHKAKDVAVCPECADNHEPEEVPDKETWCRIVREKIDSGEISIIRSRRMPPNGST